MPEQDIPFHDLLAGHLKAGTSPKPLSAGWRVTAFAQRIGCSDRTVRNWTSGERTPEPADFDAICTLLFGAETALVAERAQLTAAWEAACRRRGQPGRRVVQAPQPQRDSPTIPRPDRFIGRDALLADLTAALGAPGPVAVVVLGEGGMGKTTLARQAANAEAVVARFGARRFEARLDAARTATDLQARIAEAAGADPAQGFAATLIALGTAPALLLLDNFETCWEQEAEAVEAVLRRLAEVPGLALLATLRGREAPRAPRWTQRLRPEPLTAAAARDLFLAIAPHYRDDPDLDVLLAELGGLPLAVTLVAWRAEPDDLLAPLLAEWWRAGVAAARDGRAAPGARHGSLAQSIEFSLASPRLGPEGRRLFSLLGVLPAGLAPADAAALLGEDEAAARGQLLGVALAHRRGERLDLLPPLRRHAAEAYPPQGADAAGWVVHLLILTRGFQEEMWRKSGAPVERLGPEIPNLEAALRHAAADAPLRLAALGATWTFIQVCCFTGQGGGALRDLAAACATADDTLGEANCIYALADIARDRPDHDAARAGYEAARPLYVRVGDMVGEANCIQGLADLARVRSEDAAARAGYEAARTLYVRLGHVLGEANCICSLADIALARAEHVTARAGYEAARALYARLGHVLGEANCIQGLAHLARVRSEDAAARAGYEAARALYARLGDVVGEANCITGLADIALVRSEHAAAWAGYEAARPLYARVGTILGEANCIYRLADVALRRSAHDAARAGYEAALPLYVRLGNVVGEANCLAGLGDIAKDQGNRAEARRLYAAALAIDDRIGKVENAGITRRRLAAVDA